ncbi:hypothetical protein [Mucilaginibacter sp. 10I4]|uniref:hypothetical protein n=1 Tax=Mucilaginibacter sp. 10I4 TaxID=3048580 RepID=UPI002B234102|nr:hypothetical protein [Mucilaginibacter sp. 10I4]MEB0260744.1 hypothetical protein [Mucilaginibacter sp. 10I4]
MLDSLTSDTARVLAGGVVASVPTQLASPLEQHSFIGTVITLIVPFLLSALSQVVLTFVNKKYNVDKATTSEN